MKPSDFAVDAGHAARGTDLRLRRTRHDLSPPSPSAAARALNRAAPADAPSVEYAKLLNLSTPTSPDHLDVHWSATTTAAKRHPTSRPGPARGPWFHSRYTPTYSGCIDLIEGLVRRTHSRTAERVAPAVPKLDMAKRSIVGLATSSSACARTEVLDLSVMFASSGNSLLGRRDFATSTVRLR